MFEDLDDDLHPCEMGICDNIVAFDDEPYCYLHSPKNGAYMVGYSYRRMHRRKYAQTIIGETFVQHNLNTTEIFTLLFDEEGDHIAHDVHIVNNNTIRVAPHYDGPCKLLILVA